VSLEISPYDLSKGRITFRHLEQRGPAPAPAPRRRRCSRSRVASGTTDRARMPARCGPTPRRRRPLLSVPARPRARGSCAGGRAAPRRSSPASP
jgi:hypothetical protein